MTGSGFYGTLVEVADDTVVLRMAPDTEVKLARRAVAAKIVAPADGSEAAAAEPPDDAEPATEEDVDR
jgi:preprotein translocase subunit YajC